MYPFNKSVETAGGLGSSNAQLQPAPRAPLSVNVRTNKELLFSSFFFWGGGATQQLGPVSEEDIAASALCSSQGISKFMGP